LPNWARLFRIACSLIRQVNAEHLIIDRWSFGGGTAMMLQIGHRQSEDIDIFLHDPQLLSYLDPKLHDFEFEIMPSDYQGDGPHFLKLAFDRIGEVDFIVSAPLTDAPSTRRKVEGEDVDVETIAEIITKKVHFRGAHIKPRDIFDIAAAGRSDRNGILSALRGYRNDVESTLAAIDRLNPDFVKATIAALAIDDDYQAVAETALFDAAALLRAV
jgi:hypothetical protein